MLRLEAIEQPMVTKYDKRRRSWRSFGVDSSVVLMDMIV